MRAPPGGSLGTTVRGSGSDTSLVVRPNLYAVPCAGGYLLYSPLQGWCYSFRGRGIARLLLESGPERCRVPQGFELEGEYRIAAALRRRSRRAAGPVRGDGLGLHQHD